MKERSKSLLFVYGTLRKGFPLHCYLDKSTVKFIGNGNIQGLLYDLGEYPGAVTTSSSSTITGEVYELSDPKKLVELDKIEEFDPQKPKDSLFVRRTSTVTLESGKDILAWVYFLPKKPKNAQLINSGDYTQSLQPND